jgi:hypothetical protein
LTKRKKSVRIWENIVCVGGIMQFNFGPPSFVTGQAQCPKCKTPIMKDETMIQCPLCYTWHHKRCVGNGVSCGNRGCSYRFSIEDGMAVFEEYRGPERRKEDRRKRNIGPPDGVERRKVIRRKSDFRND